MIGSPNEITGVILIVACALAAFALRHLQWRNPNTPSDWMIRGIVIGAACIAMQRFYWDVFVGIWLLIDFGQRDLFRAYGNWLNSIWNLGITYAVWAILKGRYLLIPEDERHGYGPLRAAFYPFRLCAVFWKGRSK